MDFWGLEPRALPWADMSRAFGALDGFWEHEAKALLGWYARRLWRLNLTALVYQMCPHDWFILT